MIQYYSFFQIQLNLCVHNIIYRIYRKTNKLMITIQTSGQSGFIGEHGHSGLCMGQNGSNGRPGGRGYDALPIRVELEGFDSGYVINGIAQGALQRQATFAQGLRFHALGGHGGKGGDGGDGARGISGHNGQDATRYSSGTSGGSGGDGGDGGHGASGGDGGHGGDILVSLHSKNLDLLMLIEEHENKGGKGGQGGHGGSGGFGGSGGIGGSSYSWTETNSEGETTSHSNSGGSNGFDGSYGRSGQDGQEGRNGKDGLFEIFIQDLGLRSNTAYDLEVRKACQPVSDDLIYEQGEFLNIDFIDLNNTGGLPTPFVQPIFVSITDQPLIEWNPQNTKLISTSINSQAVFRMDQPLPFRFRKLKKIGFNQPYREVANLKFNAMVGRVNRYFKGIPNFNMPFTIQYPVEMSQVVSQKSISIDEEAPITVSIRNISSKPIGSQYGRTLSVVLQLAEGSDDLYYLQNDNQDFTRGDNQKYQPVIFPFESLLPQQCVTLTGTLRFTNPFMPLNSKSQLKFQVLMGDIENPMSQCQLIQEMDTRIQLSEKYIYNPQSEFLLVINLNTDSRIIIEIKEFCSQLGTSCDVWNASNYGGFAYDHPLQMDIKLEKILKGKVVILVNQAYEDEVGHSITIIERMGAQAVFQAATKHAIATYVFSIAKIDQQYASKAYLPLGLITDQVNISKTESLWKAEPKASNELQVHDHLLNKNIHQTINRYSTEFILHNFKRKYYCGGNPQVSHLIESCESIVEKLDNEYPQHSFHAIYTYLPKIIKQSCCRTHYNLGFTQIRQGLPKNYPMIGGRNIQNLDGQKLINADKYILVKLLPIQKKLQFIQTADIQTAKLVQQALLSDLTQELNCFMNGSKFKMNKLQKEMVLWDQFEKAQIIINEETKQPLLEEFFAYYEVVYKLPTFTDKYICCCSWKKEFRNFLCHRLMTVIYRLFSMSREQFTRLRRYHRDSQILANRSLESYGNPQRLMEFGTWLNTDPEIRPIPATELIPGQIPKQIIQEDQFKFYTDVSGYEVDKRRNKLREFESRVNFL